MTTPRQILTKLWCAIMIAWTGLGGFLGAASLHAYGMKMGPTLIAFIIYPVLIVAAAIAALVREKFLIILAGVQMLGIVVSMIALFTRGGVAFGVPGSGIFSLSITLGLFIWLLNERSRPAASKNEF